MSRTLVEVRPVVNRRDWRDFLDLPGSLHARDPNWIEPLRSERRARWSPRHPWFGHARARLWLARLDGRPVGSISAQLDGLHEQVWGERVGYFGQLEGEDDPRVFAALLDQARAWLREAGCVRMRGPFDLGINQQCGLLVEGFDTPPMLMMGHAPAYYDTRLTEQGLSAAADLLAYLMGCDFAEPRGMRRVLSDASLDIRLRPLDRRRFGQELETLRDIFNDAWSNNWGFVPLTEPEFAHLGRELRPVLRRDYIQIAEVGGAAAGFIVALPNINQAIADLNGRLLPVGWLRLLWRLRRGDVRTARVPLMGIRRQYQGSTLGAALALGLVDRLRAPFRRDHIEQVELSWILETNTAMRSLIELLGGHPYKRYRIYEQDL